MKLQLFYCTASHKCEFAIKYCLVFATASTICNINKIREKIPVANHTCDSIIPWNYAGGSPYRIQYIAKNFAGYTKYFTIQYLIVDCRQTTTTPALSTVTGQETTTTKSSTSGKQYSDSTSTFENIQCPSECSSTQTSMIIAIPVSGIVGLIIGFLLMFIILRYCNNNNKKPKNKDLMEMRSIQHQQPTVHERTTYENYTPTSDESGYEVPNQVDNKKQSGYEVPNQVDDKNEQQYEVVRSGTEYQYDN
ncbi:uncharacterized protein LOC144429794 [Styela clava]